MSKISIDTELHIDEVEHKTLLTICTTKLRRYYRVTLHFLDFHQKKNSKNSIPHLLSPLINFARVGVKFNQIINLLRNYFCDYQV